MKRKTIVKSNMNNTLPKKIKAPSQSVRKYNSKLVPQKKRSKNNVQGTPKSKSTKIILVLIFWIVPIIASAIILIKYDAFTFDKYVEEIEDPKSKVQEIIENEYRQEAINHSKENKSNEKSNLVFELDKNKENLNDIPEENLSKPIISNDTNEIEDSFLDIDIYFCKNLNDSIEVVPVSRKIDNELTQEQKIKEIFNLLMDGPSVKNNNEKSYINFINSSSLLLSCKVKNDKAILNFNEAFQFHPRGSIGLKIQIAQIVNSVTQLRGINSVEIMINNQKVKALGGEGIPNIVFNRTNIME